MKCAKLLGAIQALFFVIFFCFNLNAIGKPLEADEYFEEKLALLDQLNTVVERAIKYSNTHPDSALINAKRAIQLAIESEEELILAEMNVLIGEILEKQGNFKLAIDYLHQGLSVYLKLGDEIKIANVRNLLGRTCSNTYLFEVAMSHLEEALSIYKKLKDPLNLGFTYVNIGYVHERDSHPHQALRYYEKADSLNQLIMDENLDILIIEGKGSIYEDLEMYDSALIMYETILSKCEDNIYEKIDALNNIGDCYRKSGDGNTALGYYETAYNLAKEGNVLRKVQQNVRDLSKTYELLGQNDKALEYLKKHLEMYLVIYDQKNISSINQMQILYEFDQKNKEIELQASRVKIQHWEKNILIVGLSVFFLVILFLGYNMRKSALLNKKLSSKNRRIEQDQEQLGQANKELKELLVQLQKTQDKLVHSEKMAGLGTLSAGIAHEINNPLNYIKGGVTVIQSKLQKQADSDEEMQKLLDVVIKGVDRASGIVKSLNHFSRKSELDTENCDVHGIIDNSLLMLQYTIKGRVEVTRNYTEQSFNCIGNEGNLHQVFLNLLANSVQAIEKEGEIEICTRVHFENLIVEIQDSGSGIDSDIMKKIKDPFFTTKEPGKGTGLGLSITNRIIEDHNGSLVFESEVGAGTKTILTLPIKG